jgi:hypothetical protein
LFCLFDFFLCMLFVLSRQSRHHAAFTICKCELDRVKYQRKKSAKKKKKGSKNCTRQESNSEQKKCTRQESNPEQKKKKCTHQESNSEQKSNKKHAPTRNRTRRKS